MKIANRLSLSLLHLGYSPLNNFQSFTSKLMTTFETISRIAASSCVSGELGMEGIFSVITMSVACSTSRMRVRYIVVWVGVRGLRFGLRGGAILAMRERTGVLSL